MKKIWKTVLAVADTQDISLPAGAKILCAHEQHEQICIWYHCNPNAPKVTRRIVICGTGHDAPPQDHSRYLGSAFLQGGRFVFHVFET